MKVPQRTLIYDISNILFRVAAVQKRNPYAREADGEDLVGLCMHISLLSIFKWFNKFRPDFVVFAFEGANNWRKTYTADARSRKAYKGNRTVDPEMKHFYQLVSSFRDTMSAHTSICCLAIDGMEADDAIAGYCQLNAAEGREHLIISGDRDFIQLTKLPGVKLINPDNGKARNMPGDKDYEPDLDYWIFLKCIRGDMGDYVPSAYPKVRETKIKAAYKDDFERVNFMNATWSDENQVTHRVGDLYNENVILLDLFKQPDEIRTKLLEGVKEQTENLGKYSHFHFLRFLEEYKLNSVRHDAMKFVELLANNQRFLKGEVITKKPQQKQPTVDPTPVAAPQQSKLIQF